MRRALGITELAKKRGWSLGPNVSECGEAEERNGKYTTR